MEESGSCQKAPFVQEVEPGSYAWCACGLSSKQPFCDGAHKATAYRPVVVRIEEKKRVAWCGCKHTKTQPFCDGSHAASG